MSCGLGPSMVVGTSDQAQRQNQIGIPVGNGRLLVDDDLNEVGLGAGTCRSGGGRMMRLNLILIALLSLELCSCALAIPVRNGKGYTINGRIKVEDMGGKGFTLPAKLSNTKVILNGGQRVSFIRPDGYFSFQNIPPGTHLIEVAAIGYFFSPVRVDVSARNPGKVQAALTENRKPLSELLLEPLRDEEYYEKREPFNIMSIVKSPMGLMIGFMFVVVFLMPKLMENMDPEEIKRAQEEMSQGVPSLSSLLPRSS